MINWKLLEKQVKRDKREERKLKHQFYSMMEEWERKYPTLMVSIGDWKGVCVDFDIHPKKDITQKYKFTACYDSYERRWNFYDRKTDTKISQGFGWKVRWIAKNWKRYR